MNKKLFGFSLSITVLALWSSYFLLSHSSHSAQVIEPFSDILDPTIEYFESSNRLTVIIVRCKAICQQS